MAKAAKIVHEEAPATSPLFTAFLLLAIGWMAVAAVMSGDASADVPAPAVSNE